MLNRKGNAVALVLVAVIATVFVVVNMQGNFQIPTSSDVNATQKINSETEIVIEKALRLTTNKFLNDSFSVETKVWYYDQPVPPFIKEIDSNFNFLLDPRNPITTDINALLKELGARREYKFSDANVKIEIEQTGNNLADILALPEDKISFYVNALSILGDLQKEGKTVRLNKKIVLAQRSWLIFKKLFEWTSNSLVDLDQQTAFALDAIGPCQLAKCECNSQGLNPVISDAKAKNLVNLAKFDLNPTMEGKTQILNEAFSGTQITCNYNFIGVPELKQDIKRKQVCLSTEEQKQSYCRSKTVRKEKPNNFTAWSEKLTQDKLALTKPTLYPFNFRPVTAKTWPAEPNEPNVFVDCAGAAKDERMSNNTKVYAKIEIECSDPTTIVSVGEQQLPLTAKIQLVLAIAKSCNIAALQSAPNPNESCLGSGSDPAPGENCVEGDYGECGKCVCALDGSCWMEKGTAECVAPNNCCVYTGGSYFCVDKSLCSGGSSGPGPGSACFEPGKIYPDCGMCVCTSQGLCTIKVAHELCNSNNLSKCKQSCIWDGSFKCDPNTPLDCGYNGFCNLSYCDTTLDQCVNRQRDCVDNNGCTYDYCSVDSICKSDPTKCCKHLDGGWWWNFSKCTKPSATPENCSALSCQGTGSDETCTWNIIGTKNCYTELNQGPCKNYYCSNGSCYTNDKCPASYYCDATKPNCKPESPASDCCLPLGE